MPAQTVPRVNSIINREQDSLSVAVTALSLHQAKLPLGTPGAKDCCHKGEQITLAASCATADPPAPQPCTSPRLRSTPSSCAAVQHQSKSPNRCAALKKAYSNPSAVQTLSKSADSIPARRSSSGLTASPRRQSKQHSSLSKSTEGTLSCSDEALTAAIRRSRVNLLVFGLNSIVFDTVVHCMHP